MLEIHVIELNKTLNGSDGMDDWIRLFHVETEEELEMLEKSTDNLGILEAVREVRTMSLGKTLRLLHEARPNGIRLWNSCWDSLFRAEPVQSCPPDQESLPDAV